MCRALDGLRDEDSHGGLAAALRGCKALKVLVLAKSPVGGSGATTELDAALVSCEALEEIDLDATNGTARSAMVAFPVLAKLKALKRIVVSRDGARSGGATMLAKVVRQRAATLVKIDVDKCFWGSKGQAASGSTRFGRRAAGTLAQ